MKVLIVPDKFKGTLTAREAAEAIARGWRVARSEDNLELLPMSDGGDGFGEVMAALLNAIPQSTRTVDAAHRPIDAKWWWLDETKTALIESARVIGLALLPRNEFHPHDLDTFGLGEVFRAAIQRGATKILVGIGGSATNDGGFGMARSLGWKFWDEKGTPIEEWTELERLKTIEEPVVREMPEVVVAVDVQNPLLGPAGATRVYGPQKGLKPGEFAKAEACLAKVGSMREGAETPGAGAAGGLGFGLQTYFNGRLERGFEIFARHAQLEEQIRGADLVISGEGAVDEQTFMGKGVGEVFRICNARKVPCIALAGKVAGVFPNWTVRGIIPNIASSERDGDAASNLSKLAHQVAVEWKS